MYRQTSSLTAYVTTLRALAELSPTTLTVMHGSSYRGDARWSTRAVVTGGGGKTASRTGGRP